MEWAVQLKSVKNDPELYIKTHNIPEVGYVFKTVIDIKSIFLVQQLWILYVPFNSFHNFPSF